ncbi:hypothetical protein F4821DRAFT_229046 [Hypoxylon rubiginosum]|uniref:Uncharacterized protein n=1 Tax=Hypoxylon rubiginosum TaxID=110542 RepID=A0ACC0DC56_9PEZI|nr:hypothetical protein F4821DRAFT_229046 [Hypoxylon rubiginosum]
MPIFSSPSEARMGSLGIAALIPCPPLPNILAEWAAILPLVCNLASQRDDYITTGDIALRGRLSVGIFPRLGTFSGLARLLRRGTKYLDHASSKGGSSRIVWDVKWGSIFPCANGAAFTAISKCLMSRGKTPLQRMPGALPSEPHDTNCKRPVAHSCPALGLGYNSFKSEVGDYDSPEGCAKDEGIRRHQILHVYQLYQKPIRYSLRHRVDQLRLSALGQTIRLFLFICLAVLLCLLGGYGSATLVVCTSLSEIVALNVTIRRPAAYLRNNETHDACMLVASHENATEWHLYIGDRGIADTILNKPMFVLPEGRPARLAATWFWFANLFQFAAMTFVAAQKGWDGVWMLVLLTTHWAFRGFLYGRTLAHDWLEREGVGAEVRSFEFGGRYAMIGAIQVFSGSASASWMDNILVPHPRREAWLKCLRGEKLTDKFGPHDAKWLKSASDGSLASADVLRRAFRVGVTCKTSL